jgi:hypothetical protein
MMKEKIWTKSIADCFFCQDKEECSNSYPNWSEVTVRQCHKIQRDKLKLSINQKETVTKK